MRVTDLTKQTAVLRNMTQNTGRMQDLQENMASGRRINKLSDDPIGATQAQNYKTKISFFKNAQQNIQSNYVWLDRTETELEHISDLLLEAKNLVLAQANDSSDDASRSVTSQEVNNIVDSLIQAGNAKIGKVYIFSGSKTMTAPLARSPIMQPALLTDGGEEIANSTSERLDKASELAPFAADFEGHSSNTYRVRISSPGILGRARYVVSDDGGETWSGENTLLPAFDVVNPESKPSDQVVLHFRGEPGADKAQLVFPEGLEWIYEPNPEVKYEGNDDKRKVLTGESKTMPINMTAREVFYQDPDLPRSVNVFDVLHSIQRALASNDPQSLEKRIGDLDKAFEQALSQRSAVGAIRMEMEDQLEKLSGREFNNVKSMSEIEDLDFPAAMMELNLADTRQKASLDTAARLIQPSLLNFLR